MTSDQQTGQVRIEIDGRTFAADYTCDGDTVTVVSAFGSKSQSRDGNPPDRVARALLRELIALDTRQLD